MIAKTLKSLRFEKGLSQKELSEKLNIGQATIACYENGKREPHITSLKAYADFFECSIDYLVGRADDLGNVNIDVKFTSRYDEDEKRLLDKIKKLDNAKKKQIEGYIDALNDHH